MRFYIEKSIKIGQQKIPKNDPRFLYHATSKKALPKILKSDTLLSKMDEELDEKYIKKYSVNEWCSLTRSKEYAEWFGSHTHEQKSLVAEKHRNFDPDRIIALDKDIVVDGNHHLIAALQLHKPVQYIDLSEAA